MVKGENNHKMVKLEVNAANESLMKRNLYLYDIRDDKIRIRFCITIKIFSCRKISKSNYFNEYVSRIIMNKLYKVKLLMTLIHLMSYK